jgi:hemolysin III
MNARTRTLNEELLNAISHGIGFLLSVASLPVFVLHGGRGDRASVVGAVVFSVTMMLLYLASTVYHALPEGRAKQWFNRLDHAAIFLFIAGSYTPFVLGPLRSDLGWTLFGLVWACALAGMLLKVLNRLRHPLWSTGVYVAMGWLALIAAAPLLDRVGAEGLALLVAGGVAYTVGVVFFLLDGRLRYSHFIWHLFVLAGSTCHFFAALRHAA